LCSSNECIEWQKVYLLPFLFSRNGKNPTFLLISLCGQSPSASYLRIGTINGMSSRSYQDLVGWQKSMALVAEVYRHTKDFPPNEIYGLTSQLRRAAVSIPSNIAEGQGRLSPGEFKQFLGHAKGSAFEVETQLLIARDLGYIGHQATSHLIDRVQEVGRILSGLLASLGHTRTSH
jgi:four helix bundle protein